VSGLASKPLSLFLGFGLKTNQRFGDLGLKITMTVSWFVPQNHVGGGLSVCALKTDK
jgi:hypothetical protein